MKTPLLTLYLLVTITCAKSLEDCVLRFEDNGVCACSSHDKAGLVKCHNYSSSSIEVQPCYCMYYDPALNLSTLGHCYFSCHQPGDIHIQINNSAEFNEDICDKYGFLHRTGRFCGECNSSYGLAAYSYEPLSCTPCQDHGYKNWIKYFAVALLPLTVFYILAVLLSFNVTSSSLNGVVLVIQCITSPVQMTILSTNPHIEHSVSLRSALLKAIICMISMANLDFFRIVYSPFCLHPKANVLQILSLDYIVALYPFLLIFITYVLVTAHDKQYRLVVWIWKPFKICVHQYHNTWNIHSSLIEIFATFILLSSVKILGVSFQILTYTNTYRITGESLNHLYLSNDASIEYFGATHLPYALLAIAISSIFVVLPFLLLAVYPCRCFHKCLNHCGPRFQALHVFMDAFQGSYRTQPRDMRYFSAFYLFLRMLMLAQPQIFPSTLFFFTSGILSLASAAAVTIFQPYKVKSHNTMDSVLMLLMGIYFITYHEVIVLTSLDYGHQWVVAAAISYLSTITLIAIFFSLILWKLLGSVIQDMVRKLRGKWKSVWRRHGENSNGEETDLLDRELDISAAHSYSSLLEKSQTY